MATKDGVIKIIDFGLGKIKMGVDSEFKLGPDDIFMAITSSNILSTRHIWKWMVSRT